MDLLDEIIIAARENGASADNIARKFFASRRYAGSKDRRAIRDLTWDAIRRFGERPQNARSAFAAMADRDAGLADLFDGSSYGPALLQPSEPRAKGGFLPEWILPHLSPLVTEAEREASLDRAPIDLRVNTLKATMADIVMQLPEAEQVMHAPNTCRLPTGFSIEQHPLMLDGKVDIQDLGSQVISSVCGASAGMTVLDLCAGAGGKTLALAADMCGEGKLTASDTNRARLDQLMPRAARAGATNIEPRLLNPGNEHAMLSDLRAKCDIVLVDAPCSGSGTWRRNPETRWRLNEKRLQHVVIAQAKLMDIAAEMVAPGGHLVYAVCSLINAEGIGQVDRFLNDNKGWRSTKIAVPIGRTQGAGILLTPMHDNSDGFFMARLQKL
jgi:16S rRNA (cytosine967-C5)-methyltransferase